MTKFIGRAPIGVFFLITSITIYSVGCSAGDVGSDPRVDVPGHITDAAPPEEGSDGGVDRETDAPSALPPLAVAGVDQVVEAGERVILDAFESTSSQGILRYRWSQVDGLPVELEGADQEMSGFRAPLEPALLEFELEVMDEHEAIAHDRVVVQVIQLTPHRVRLERSPFRAAAIESPIGANPFEVDFEDGYAYVASGHYGLLVVDFRDLD